MSNGQPQFIDPISDIDPVTGLTSDPRKVQTPKLSGSSFVDPIPGLVSGAPTDVGLYDATKSKYDEDITLRDLQTGRINEERAFTQPVADKWGNGLTKFAGKTATAVLGGTIGTLAGIPNIFIEGKSVYDNQFQQMLDNWNEGMDEALPNYMTSIEKEEGFLQSLNNANFWANDVLGGLSFTAGAVLTELAWSAATAATLGAAAAGQASATSAMIARAGRYFKNFRRADDVTQGLIAAKRAQQLSATARTGRQVWTGAGYEAGVEARGHKKEITDKLRAEWLEANPTAQQIPENVLADIDDRATTSANGVFAANMAIVGSSNMLALPRIYGPGIGRQMNAMAGINKQLKDVGGAWKQVFTPAYKDASTLKKIAEASFLTVKNPFVEGVWEEGMQGVSNNTALDYTTKKYNPNGTDEVVNLMDSFGEGLQETYGGKEGWKEIGIGIIIGSIGSPNFRAYKRNEQGKLKKQPGVPVWTGGIAGEFQERNLKRRRADKVTEVANNVSQEEMIEYLRANPDYMKNSRSTSEHMIRTGYLNKEMDTAMDGGDVFEAKNVENDIIHSYITSRINAGYGADLKDEFNKTVSEMSDEDFATEFGYEGLDEQSITDRKRETVDAFNKRVDDTVETTNLVDSVFQADLSVDRNKDIRESLIYAGSNVKNVQEREDTVSARVTELTGVSYDPTERGTDYKEQFEADVNAAIAKNPENKVELEKLMKDLDKLQRRRELFTKQYNYLFTKQGQKEYANLINESIKQTIKDQVDSMKNDLDAAEVIVDVDSEKRYKKYTTEDGTTKIVEIDENNNIIEGTEEDFEVNDESVSRFVPEQEKVVSENFTPEESEAIINYLNSETDQYKLIDYIRDVIAPRNLARTDPVYKAAEEAYFRLTGKKLNPALLTNIKYEDGIFMDKESGKKVLIRKDNTKDDTYYVKEIRDRDNNTNIETLTRDQVVEKYKWVKNWEQFKEKQQVVENIEGLIDSKLELLDKVETNKKSFREELDDLVKENEALLAKLKRQKGDGRATRKSIKETNKLIERNAQMIEALQVKINRAVRAQAKIEAQLLYLEERQKEELDSNEIVNLKERIKNTKEDIEYNRSAIERWRDVKTNLEKLTNKLLNLFNIGNAYVEKSPEQAAAEYEAQLRAEMFDYMTAGGPTEVVMIDGRPQKVSSFEWHQRQKKAEEIIRRKVAAKKAAITRAIDKAVKAEGELLIAEEKMEQAENQMYAFTQANNDLFDQLEYIKEEVSALEQHKKSSDRQIKGFTTYANKEEQETSRSSEPESQEFFDAEDVSSDPLQGSEELKFWKGIKRSIKDVFRGLTGKHVESDNKTLTSDPDQRRYYRWVSKTDIAGEQKYAIEIVVAPESDRAKIEAKGYKFEDTFYARVIDEDGNYVQEDGSTTKKFSSTKNIYTSFPLASLTTEEYGDKFYTPETAEEFAKIYGPRPTLEEAKKAFEDDKRNQLRDHNALVADIKRRKADGQKVILNLVDKSLGIPNDPNRELPQDQRPVLSVQDALGHNEVIMSVNTMDELPISHKTLVNNRKGITFVYDERTGNVYEAKPKKLKENQIDVAVNMVRSFVGKTTVAENGFVSSKDASKLTYSDGSRFDKHIFQVLTDFSFWTGDNVIKNKNTGKTREINKNNSRRFHFSKNYSLNGRDRVDGGAFNIGGTHYPLLVVDADGKAVLDVNGQVQINEALVAPDGTGALRTFLEGQNFNINSSKLRSDSDFIEVTSVSPEGVVTTQKHTIEEGGYQRYVLGTGEENHNVGLSVVKKGSEMAVTRDEQGNEIREEAPQMLSQYAIFDKKIISEPEQREKKEPTTKPAAETKAPTGYTGFGTLKTGDRINVDVVNTETGNIDETGVLEVDEDGNLVPVEAEKSTLNDNVIHNINQIKGSDDPIAGFDYVKGLYQKDKKQDIVIEGVVEDAAPAAAPAPVAEVELAEGDIVYDIIEGEEYTYVGIRDDNIVLKDKDGKEIIDPKFGVSKQKPSPASEAYDDQPYRTPTNDNRGTEKLSKAEKWFKERFPDIDFRVVQHLIDGKHDGQLRAAAVYIYENADVGTTYHEAFHVVTHVFLNRRERRALYREYRKRNPQYASRGDGFIEEQLAEQFREYILYREETASGEKLKRTKEEEQAENERFKKLLKEFNSPDVTPERKAELDTELANMYYAQGEMISHEAKKFKGVLESYKAPVQKSLFEKIYDWIINAIYGRQRSIMEVFEGIEANEFRNETPNIKFSKNVVLNRSPKGKDEVFTRAALEGINFHFFKKLLREDESFSTLFSKEANNKLVTDLYDYAKGQINAKIATLQNALVTETNEVEKARLETIIDELSYMIKNWDVNTNYTNPTLRRTHSMVGLHKAYLQQYRIEFVNVEDTIQETNKSVDPDNQWANESIKISSKLNASRNIKLMLGTLVDVDKVGPNQYRTKTNVLELPMNVDFGTAFNILSNKLAGLTTITDMRTALISLVEEYPAVNFLMSRLKMDVDPTSLTEGEMQQQIQFVQTFSKFNNNYTLDITGPNGKFKIVDANEVSQRKTILQNWKNNSAKKKIFVEKDSVPYYKKSVANVPPIRTGQDALDFLKSIGIVFTEPQKIINDPVLREKAGAIRQSIAKGNQISVFNIDFDTDHRQNFQELINLEVNSTLNYIEGSHYNLDGDLVYNIVPNNYLTLIVNDTKNFARLDDFLAENPHLDPANNFYVAHSMLLTPGGALYDSKGKRREGAMELFIHEGSKEEASGQTSEFDDHGEPDQLRVHINLGLQKTFPLLRPADNSIERYLKFKKQFFDKNDIADNKHIGQMVNYLKDELVRGVSILENDDNSANWLHARNNAKDGIIISMISNNSIISDALDKLFSDSEYTVNEFLGDNELMDLVENELKLYFNEKLNSMRDLVVKHGIVQEDGSGGYINNGLNVRESESLSSPQLDALDRTKLDTTLREYIVNDTVSNIEQTKLIFGDPAQYRNVNDQFKRHSGVVGTKKISVTYDQVNKWIEKNLKRTDRKGGLYDKLGNGKPIIRTVVFDDVRVKSDYYNQYLKILGEEKASFYAEMDEGDGQGYITIDEWREMLYRAGDWSFGVGSLEDLYQYETQKERGIEVPTDPKTGRVIDRNKLPVANPLKPQHMGPLAEEGFHMGMYKLSLFPLMPSVTKGFAEMEALRTKMKASGTGIAVFHTANKVGTKIKTDDNPDRPQAAYNLDGEFAFKDSDFVTQDTYYKYWGIQQDMGSKVKKRVVSGTQMAKQIINGIFENGKPKNENLGRLANEYEVLNKERILIGVGQFLDSVGLKKVGEEYVVDNLDDLIERFQKEAIEREMPDNIVDAIGNLKKGSTIDTLVNKEKIENIILAVADSMTTSQKRSGSPKVQVSNAFGKKTRVVDNIGGKGVVYKSSDLKFYSKENGNVTQMEVYLPAYLKGRIPEGKLRNLIGFRIPTQGLNSIESIIVKGFLPASAGDSIIVPSEIVAKTGSDFDIDKLNLYYPNVYYDRDGNPQYIEYHKDAKEYKDAYAKYEDALLGRFISRIVKGVSGELNKAATDLLRSEAQKVLRKEGATFADLIEHIDKLLTDARRSGSIGNAQQAFAYGQLAKEYDAIRLALEEVSKEGDSITSADLDPMTFNEFVKRGIENRISEIQKDIILDKDNFKQLITPISAKNLSDEALEILFMRGEATKDKDGNIKRKPPTMSNLVEREYLMSVARRFIGGKKAIGITAIHSTFDILSKKSNISVVPEILVYRNDELKPVSTEIRLPHNKNAQGNISLSKLTAKNSKQNIPETLSQWINAAVDAATDPFMFDLNSGPTTLNTVLYLTMAGVPVEYLTRFMTQPIIVEYMANREKWESQMMEGNTSFEQGPRGEMIEVSKKKFRDGIIAETETKYITQASKASALNNPVEQFTVEQLEENIKRGARLDSDPNARMSSQYAKQQIQILNDFLRYQDTAKKLSENIRAVDYDTNAGGKNTSELAYKLENTERVKQEAVLENFDSLLNKGFITPYYTTVEEFKKILDPLFITLSDKSIVDQFNKLYNVLFDEAVNISRDAKIKVVDKFKQDFITYLMTTRPFSVNGRLYQKDGVSLPMNTQIDRLFMGNKDQKSIAHRLDEKRKLYIKEGRRMKLLDHLESVIAEKEGETNHIIARTKKLDTLESNTLTNEFQELFDRDPDFALDLAMAGILQYGTQNSPFTYVNLIPFGVYGEIMASVINDVKGLPEDFRTPLYSEFYEQFFQNNYESDDIVPVSKNSTRLRPIHRAYPYYKQYKLKPEHEGKSRKELSELKSKNEYIMRDKPVVSSSRNSADKPTLRLALRDFRNSKLLTAFGMGKLPLYPDNLMDREVKSNSYNQLNNATDQAPNKEIDDRVKAWMDSMGIAYQNVEQITDRDGNPIDAIAKADMLHSVVQVVEGKADITTLSEEAAHFLVELLGDDNPLLKGMMNSIEDTKIYKETVAEYSELYDNDPVKLRKEAVGKAIAQAIIKKQKIENQNAFQNWFDRAWKWLKRHLSRVSSSLIEDDLAPFAEAADIIFTNRTDGLPALESINSEDIFYEVTPEEKQEAEVIEGHLNANKVSRDLEKKGYKTPDGKHIRNRVTDAVNRFNKKRFRRGNLKEWDVAAQKGTIIHKYLEIIGTAAFEGRTVSWKDAERQVIKDLTDPKDKANEEFLDKDESFFKLRDGGQFGELVNGVNKIKDQVIARQKRIDPKGEVKFFPEFIVYDQDADVAGTIDLLVMYSNGAVGVYDYKGKYRLKEKGEIPVLQEQTWEIQITGYKDILAKSYGVKNFAETRIIPIDMMFNLSDPKGFTRIGMGSIGLNDAKRPYLEQVPVARELTDDAKLNVSLNKMLNLFDTLRTQLMSDYNNDDLRLRLEKLRQSIKKIQLETDVSFVYGEISSLYEEFTKREPLPYDHKDGLDDDALNEIKSFVDVFEMFGVNAMDAAEEAGDKRAIEDLKKVAHILEYMKIGIRQKLVENANAVSAVKVDAPAKAEGFAGRLFKQLSKFNRPVFKRLSEMIRNISDETRKEVNKIADDVGEKTEALKKWGSGRGENLKQVFGHIINDKTGNLINKFSPEFYEAKRKAFESKNKTWIIKNMNVEVKDNQFYYTGDSLKRFTEARDKYIDKLKRTYPGDAQRDFRNTQISKWNRRFDITEYPEAIFSNANYFMSYKEQEESYSTEYNFMLKPENKAVFDYYNMYLDYNKQFAEMTGKPINSNFVAEIHTDLIDKIGETGVNAVRGIKDSFMRAIEIREFDMTKGTIDPATGKPLQVIPLFHTDRLKGRIDKKEIEAIRQDIIKEGEIKENSEEFEPEVQDRIRRLEYSKGVKSKSRDLSRSLIMFAETAVSYKLLNEAEGSALALREILKSQTQETEIVDAAGRKVINQMTQKAATMFGVPASEVDALDQFINLYFYGQSTQGGDIGFGKDRKYSATKAYQQIISLTSATAIGMKPILAAGNALGIKSNFYMTGAEGLRYKKEDIKKAHDMVVRRDKNYKLIIDYFQPHTRNITKKRADDLSASKMARTFTMDNIYIMHRKGDEMIDNNILVAMMHRYGIDENGKIQRLDKIKGEDKRPLIERMSVVDDKVVIEGLTDVQYTRFRSMVQRTAVGIKGNIPEEDKNLIGATLIGQMLMQFRSWMPGLIEKRFKELGYDDLFEDYDVGRFRVFVGEFFTKGAQPALKKFTNLLGEVAMMNVYNRKGIDNEVTQKFYDKYKLENPETTLTMEEFVELRKAKLRGMAAELRIYLSFILLVTGGKAFLPEEDDETGVRAMLNLMAQNSFRVTQRGLLEISFFFEPESVSTILKSPVPSFNFFVNVGKMLKNTVDETRDIVVGEDSPYDRTPGAYYFSKIVPIGSSAVDFFDMWDTYNKERGY